LTRFDQIRLDLSLVRAIRFCVSLKYSIILDSTRFNWPVVYEKK